MQSHRLQFKEDVARFTFADDRKAPAKIIVIGVGGAGGNAVNRMIATNIEGVDLVAVNTDIQVLGTSLAPMKLQIGAKLTNGLGCGGIPEIGRQAALEDTERIIEVLEGADMVFITGGMGGGTCTGAAPIIAGLAAEVGALTVAVVTKPFNFLGKKRRAYAETGIRELKEAVDSMIIIPNENLLDVMDEGALLEDSFCSADDILCQAVQGISDIITKPGIVNVDFADVRTIMSGSGMALMGTGTAEGSNRAAEAAQRALSSPLLEETPIRGAKVLMNITSSQGMLKLHEAHAAARIVEEKTSPEEMIFGAVYDESMGDRIKITVIATGFGQDGSERLETAAGNSLPGGTVGGLNPAIASGKTVDFRRESAKDNLDEPAFRRRRAR